MKQNLILQNIYLKSPVILKSIYATIYSLIVSKRKYGKYYRYWAKTLSESQYFSKNDLQEFQKRIFKQFISDIYNNSTFYKNIIDRNNIDIKSFKDIDVIKNFPIINKIIVRENQKDIQNKNIPSFVFSSSGTTGTSLHVMLSKKAYQREYAFRWQYLKKGGASRKDKFAYLLGNKLFQSNKEKPPFHIIDYFEKGIYFSIFHMSEKNLYFYLKTFNKYKPIYIKGYPSAIYTFADFIIRNNLNVNPVKAVFCASETLHDYQSQTIRNVFNCEVFEWYGQVETTVNVQECECHNYHIMEDYGYLELFNSNGDDAKPGEIAKVIGTGWGNIAFPLIRYDTGDNMILSTKQKCACGRTGRIIEKIIGRDEDIIITPDGRRIGRLDFVFKPIDSVLQSQIIQEDLNNITIKIVPLSTYVKSDEIKIIKKLQEYIGDEINITVQKVSSIEQTKNGKIRYVISNVKPIN